MKVFRIYLSDLIVNLWFFVQFYIIVEDVNDNMPLFDASEYTLEIKEHSTLGTEALRPKSDKSNPPSKYIFATDADLKSVRPRSMEKCEVGTGNGDVTYKIVPENPLFKGKL